MKHSHVAQNKRLRKRNAELKFTVNALLERIDVYMRTEALQYRVIGNLEFQLWGKQNPEELKRIADREKAQMRDSIRPN